MDKKGGPQGYAAGFAKNHRNLTIQTTNNSTQVADTFDYSLTQPAGQSSVAVPPLVTEEFNWQDCQNLRVQNLANTPGLVMSDDTWAKYMADDSDAPFQHPYAQGSPARQLLKREPQTGNYLAHWASAQVNTAKTPLLGSFVNGWGTLSNMQAARNPGQVNGGSLVASASTGSFGLPPLPFHTNNNFDDTLLAAEVNGITDSYDAAPPFIAPPNNGFPVSSDSSMNVDTFEMPPPSAFHVNVGAQLPAKGPLNALGQRAMARQRLIAEQSGLTAPGSLPMSHSSPQLCMAPHSVFAGNALANIPQSPSMSSFLTFTDDSEADFPDDQANMDGNDADDEGAVTDAENDAEHEEYVGFSEGWNFPEADVFTSDAVSQSTADVDSSPSAPTAHNTARPLLFGDTTAMNTALTLVGASAIPAPAPSSTEGGESSSQAEASDNQAAARLNLAEKRRLGDEFIVRCRLQGISYKRIKVLGKFTEAESTLRGRYRAKTKPKHERPRRPTWANKHLNALIAAVFKVQSRSIGGCAGRLRWGLVAREVKARTGYGFGFAACRKKWEQLVDAGYVLPLQQ
ncbi:hypothetical protein G7046_g103 [Stylonectria norvegica]|nr:hypothetical protein G7046_g103 [Stylonectria norvegica]